MSAKAIREQTGKELLGKYLSHGTVSRFAVVTEETNWDTLTAQNPWLLKEVSGYPNNNFFFAPVLQKHSPNSFSRCPLKNN